MNRSIGVASMLAALALLLSTREATAQTQVDTCGQAYTGYGYLAADLDCTGYTGSRGIGAAVSVGDRGTFDLRGFTLRGGEYGVLCGAPCPGNPDADCSASCKIVGGGGTVTGAVHTGIVAERVKISGLTVSDNGGRGIDAVFKLAVTSSTITGNGDYGATSHRMQVTRSTVTGNAGGGLGGANFTVRGKMAVRRSAVTGNGTNCDEQECCDLDSDWKPRLGHSTCDRSCAQAGSWHICSLD